MKYWLKIATHKPLIVYDIYILLLRDANTGKTNWVSNVRDLLFSIGLNFVWYQQSGINISLDVIKTRLKDQYIQSWSASIQDCEKLTMYRILKLDFCFEDYVDYNYNSHFFTKLRSGTMKLNVEVGRYTNILRENRLCTCCNMKSVEDEYHFTLVCPVYRHVRLQFLPNYYCSWPNVTKLMYLYRTKSRSLVGKLCNYLKSAWQIRSHLLS